MVDIEGFFLHIHKNKKKQPIIGIDMPCPRTTLQETHDHFKELQAGATTKNFDNMCILLTEIKSEQVCSGTILFTFLKNISHIIRKLQ